MKELQEVRTLKENRYILIDDEPCRIVSIQVSKPGKHGSAKARIDAIGIFDGNKRSGIYGQSDKVGVPMIDKRNAQVLAIMGDQVQLMDIVTFETFELPIPEDMKEDIVAGGEVQYFTAMGRRKMTRATAGNE